MDNKRLIYAVDDETSIRELYACALESAGFDARCFIDGEALFEALAETKPELILLDIMLDGMDGYKILDSLKDDIRYRNIPVIMVSAKGEEVSKVKGLNLGADDYISKPFGVLELIARVNANIRKRAKTGADIFKDIRVNESLHEITKGSEKLGLTLKEYKLLKLLVENAGEVLTRDGILNSVWGEDYFGETRTLDMHIKELRKKLTGSAAEIVTVRGVGYTLK